MSKLLWIFIATTVVSLTITSVYLAFIYNLVSFTKNNNNDNNLNDTYEEPNNLMITLSESEIIKKIITTKLPSTRKSSTTTTTEIPTQPTTSPETTTLGNIKSEILDVITEIPLLITTTYEQYVRDGRRILPIDVRFSEDDMNKSNETITETDLDIEQTTTIINNEYFLNLEKFVSSLNNSDYQHAFIYYKLLDSKALRQAITAVFNGNETNGNIIFGFLDYKLMQMSDKIHGYEILLDNIIENPKLLFNHITIVLINRLKNVTEEFEMEDIEMTPQLLKVIEQIPDELHFMMENKPFYFGDTNNLGYMLAEKTKSGKSRVTMKSGEIGISFEWRIELDQKKNLFQIKSELSFEYLSTGTETKIDSTTKQRTLLTQPYDSVNLEQTYWEINFKKFSNSFEIKNNYWNELLCVKKEDGINVGLYTCKLDACNKMGCSWYI